MDRDSQYAWPGGPIKTLVRFALVFVLLLGFCGGIAVADDAPFGDPFGGQWNVRVEVLMVAVPEEKCLPLLPKLRNPETVDEAVAQLLDYVAKKQAILTGYPFVQTLNGQRAVSESVVEKRFPTAPVFLHGPEGPNPDPAAPPAPPVKESDIPPEARYPIPMPAAFDERHLGVTLEAEPSVSNDGKFVTLNVTASRVALIGTDFFDGGTTPKGEQLRVQQPQFLSNKDTFSAAVRNGEHLLFGAHPLQKPAGYVELFILQAVATPIKVAQ
jgi:hypothetical protein